VAANFLQSLEQGSKYCISEVYQTAVGHYRTALRLLSKHSDLQVAYLLSAPMYRQFAQLLPVL